MFIHVSTITNNLLKLTQLVLALIFVMLYIVFSLGF